MTATSSSSSSASVMGVPTLLPSAVLVDDELSLDDKLAALLSHPQRFSVAEYLNLALRDVLDHDKNDGTAANNKKGIDCSNDDRVGPRLAELALQLQVQTAACHEEVGRISAELQAVLPRCAADVGRLGVGLDGLQQDAASLLDLAQRPTTHHRHRASGQEATDHPNPVEHEETSETATSPSSSLETLSTLHALQAHLSRTRDVLTAAATWDATLSSVPPLLAQQNWSEAVSALNQLERGERALRGMPHPEQRHSQLVQVRDQVSALLQPQLQLALSHVTTRIGPLQQCVQLYAQLGTVSIVIDEYVKHRPSAIHRAWFDFDPNQQPLAQWLPRWYQAVLGLLSEERRHCQAAFGLPRVPEILARIVRECFRPLRASFGSRLEHHVGSSRTADIATPSVGGAAKGVAASGAAPNLDALCATYEATLQFLSLAYDAVAGAWLDVVEAGGTAGGAGATSASNAGVVGEGDLPATAPPRRLFKDLRETMVQVAAPFAAYQERLPDLEHRYLTQATAQLAKDIQNALSTPGGSAAWTLDDPEAPRASTSVGSPGDGNDDWSAATDGLLRASTGIWTVAEGSLARLELLTGGYGAASVLAVLDRALAAHHDELALAIDALNARCTPKQQQHPQNAGQLDESHVTGALQALLLAGTVQRRAEDWSRQTRERLGVMADRMASHTTRFGTGDDSTDDGVPPDDVQSSRRASGAPPSFALPDALSAVEIDSFVTQAVCENLLEAASSTLATLQRLAGTGSATNNPVMPSTAVILFPQLQTSVQRLSRACHNFVFDTCSAVPLRQLSSIPSMPCWKAAGSSVADAASYGTLPQPYITQVGEHMLALVQALEPFASNPDSLALANEVMGDVRNVALQPWKDFVKATGGQAYPSSDGDKVVQQLMDGRALLGLVSGPSSFDDEEDERDGADGGADPDAKASAAFCNAWLDAVGCAVTGRLLERVMRIPSLSLRGCEHLHTDLNYLVNVMTALGVSGHPHPLLGHVAEAAALDGDALVERLAQRDPTVPLEKAIAAMEERLAAMRGVAARFHY